MLPFVEGMVEFLHRSAADENRTSEVLKSCVGLLGDMGQTFGAKMQPIYQMPFVPALIQQAQQQGDDDIQEIAQWTQSVSSLFLDLEYFSVTVIECSQHLLFFAGYCFADGGLRAARQINLKRPSIRSCRSPLSIAL